MRAELVRVDAPAWASFLEAGRHDFYHLPAYVALSAAQERGEARALHVVAGARSLLLPLILRSIPASNFRDATSPYGYPGPLVAGGEDPAFLEDALAAGVDLLRGAGVVSAFVRLHPILNPSPPTGIGTLVHQGETVSVDLSLPAETLWDQMRLDHRRGIKRAIRLGYVARMDEDWSHLGTFRDLYRATMERRGAASFYYFEDAYFDGLRDALRDRLHLCVVERQGEIAAAGLYAETSGIVQYHLSGSAEAARSIQPTKLMMHFALGWGKARGNRYLHLGGGVGAGSDSLLQFKGGFSPLRHTFSTLRIVIDEDEYRRLVTGRDPELDPAARSGFFPLYRQE
jgi:hypothetical protein